MSEQNSEKSTDSAPEQDSGVSVPKSAKKWYAVHAYSGMEKVRM